MRLAFRFTVALVAALTVALMLNALLRVRREVVLFDQAIASDARAMSRTLEPFVAATWRADGEDGAKALVANASDSQDVRIRLKFLGRSDADGAALSEEESATLQRTGSVIRKQEEENVVTTYVGLDLPSATPAVLEFSEPRRGQAAFVRRTIAGAVFTAVVLTLLCAAAAMGLGVVFIGRPVRALVAQAQRIGAGDFSTRLGLRQRDEIGQLAREFDLMSERLAEARDELKAATDAKLAALDQLRHVERVATVGKLAAGIAHELGTPLQVVSGYARLVSEDPSASADVQDNASVIHEQASRMATIIGQLLDFARQRRTERSLTNLAEVVERSARLLVPVTERADVRLVCDVEPSPPCIAVVDGDQLIQVVSNLVVNAVQAMPKGGTVTIGLAHAERGPLGQPGPHVRLSVRDEGLGMVDDVRSHVFEPFFTTKPTGEGTGLGLSVAYGIVQEHGGTFDVQSEPGRGSTFTVWLPAADKATADSFRSRSSAS